MCSSTVLAFFFTLLLLLRWLGESGDSAEWHAPQYFVHCALLKREEKICLLHYEFVCLYFWSKTLKVEFMKTEVPKKISIEVAVDFLIAWCMCSGFTPIGQLDLVDGVVRGPLPPPSRQHCEVVHTDILSLGNLSLFAPRKYIISLEVLILL